MRQTKIHTLLWLTAGLFCSLLVILTVLTGLSGKVLISDPEGIRESADAVMNAIQSGDWNALEDMVLGNPVLIPATGEEGSAERIIYYAYQESLRWTCKEEFQIQGSYVTQRISLTCLDIRCLTSAVAETLAESALSEDRTQLLRSATEQVLITYVPIAEQEITLVFLREQGQWKLVPNTALQTLLSGFTVL